MNEAREDKILNKIRKILSLAENNPSQEEAESAAAKAQKLMADYHLTMVDLETGETERLFESAVETGTGNKWKYSLAKIIADNFRCKCFIDETPKNIVFYGYKLDSEIAAETFRSLYLQGNKIAQSKYNALRYQAKVRGETFNGRGVKNAYLLGYVMGIQEVLAQQCTALMLVTPKEVESGFDSMWENTPHKDQNTSFKYGTNEAGQQAYNDGVLDGRRAMQSNYIEQKED